MPRCFSSSIQSDVAARCVLRPRTAPATSMQPPNSSSFSVSVVLPASGCEMIANVRRRETSRRTDGRRRGVRFGRASQVGHGLAERQLAFGQPDELAGLHRRHGQRQRLRIGVADVLAGQDHQPPADEADVFAASSMRASQYSAASGSLPRMLLISALAVS
jgi:hypothetical protein